MRSLAGQSNVAGGDKLAAPPLSHGDEQTLLAAASHYRVRWPLPHVLQYAQARMLEPEERGWVVIAAAMAMLNGYLTPKDKTPRRRPA